MSIYQVDRNRWASMSIFEQFGNVYSEVGRSFAAKQIGDLKGSQDAMFRTIDLFDATVEVLLKKKSPKVKEVLRAKEEYLDAMNDPELSEIDLESLEKYFMQFAMAARLNRNLY